MSPVSLFEVDHRALSINHPALTEQLTLALLLDEHGVFTVGLGIAVVPAAGAACVTRDVNLLTGTGLTTLHGVIWGENSRLCTSDECLSIHIVFKIQKGVINI